MLDGILNMSLGSLFEKLHESMLSFVKNMDGIVKENSELPLGEIKELREHIKGRLERNEEIGDNQKLLKLLDLLSTDRAVLELVKEEAEEWAEMLEAIERSLPADTAKLTAKEREEVEKIGALASEIKGMIRKEG